ncbi:MAG: carboxypeptidase regulatory-like domain-containing protein [Rhodanobacteraceae bacterium]|nr:carboxypeptidase regulatory-like domain-containing protein [Rhodanobacteraceae bacterium]
MGTLFRRVLLAAGCWLLSGTVLAQANGTPPPGASCVVTAGNRNAPLAADGSYVIFGIPGSLGAIRARAVCSDGSLGQSAVGFTDPLQDAQVELGPIQFGRFTPSPQALSLSAPQRRLDAGAQSQLKATAVAADGSERDVTPRSEGTVYALSSELLASVTENGRVTVHADFAPGASARLVAQATTEGSVASSFVYVLGPRGTLRGRVVRADGTTAVAGAQVSVLRLQPMEQAGTAVSNPSGEFELGEVNAGGFLISAIDPASGDRALGGARIEREGEVATVELRLNGQGTADITVVDATNAPVAATEVTFAALGSLRDVRTLATDAQGKARFSGVPAGTFTVSARDPVSRLVGAAVSSIAAGQTRSLTLRLQPTGTVHGAVFDADGGTRRAGVQVRAISRERGIVSQRVTGADGAFRFDSLPLSDGPFTLDAFVDGRVRARVPAIVLSQPNQVLERNITLGAVGTVRGQVGDGAGQVFADARVTLQSLVGQRLTFEVRSDAQGRYVVPGVPLGAFELTAITAEGRSGHAQGQLASDGGTVTVDVLIASNALAGTVFERDAVTPVGAGVAVFLAPRALGPRYSYEPLAGNPAVLRTATDAQGRFSFAVTRADAYYVQAEAALERGRSEVVVVNLDPPQPLQARVVFLARGRVSGRVGDPQGLPQANVPVTVHSAGLFEAERSVQTDAQGRYSVDGVFAGEVTATARNPATQLSGFNRARLDHDGQPVELDITLAASGSVAGRVLRRDGSLVPGPVRISLRRDRVVLASQDVADGSAYRFDLVPVGEVEVVAQELGNGDRGAATTRIASAGETRQLDVRLVGQGRVRVRLVDAGGAPVTGARVALSTASPFATTAERESGADGQVEFERVFHGDYRVTASRPAPIGSLSGSAAGTLLPGADADLTLTLTALATGRIQGRVLAPDGLTPLAGMAVRLQPEPFPGAYLVTSDAQGNYAFDRVEAGGYTIDVHRSFSSTDCTLNDRLRGRAVGVVLSAQDQTIARDVQLIGQGQVGGSVRAAGGGAARGASVQLVPTDLVYGPPGGCGLSNSYDAVADEQGRFLFPDVPPGAFALQGTWQDQRGEGAGRVRFDGDVAEVPLQLADSVVDLPLAFHDANGFLYDVGADGRLLSGLRNVFGGSGPDSGGVRLELIRNDVAVPFANGGGSLGRLRADGQEVELDENHAFGLRVVRRVLAPRAGYFVRYVETLENTGSNPVTVDVRVRTHHSGADGSPRVVDSSDGDAVLSVADPQLRDRWAVIDDQSDSDPFTATTSPPSAHLFDGSGAAVQVAQADYELIGSVGRLNYRWNSVTVAPGQRVSLMHFALNQVGRQNAREAALRLAQLPPEAIDDLTTDERRAIANFAVPDHSALAPLPNLAAGAIDGRVFSGDGVTPIASATVTFRSKHPLFARARHTTGDAQGAFEFRSHLDGSSSNAVVPIHAFDLVARHPSSGASTATTPGDFAPLQTRTTQDLVFAGSGDLRGLVKRHNQATVGGAVLRLCTLDDRGRCNAGQPTPVNTATSAEDGSYALLANAPRAYFLFADQPHPQGSALWGRGQGTVIPGGVTVAPVTMEATGSIAGSVRSADGTPLANARVLLFIDGTPPRLRETRTDTSGAYRLFDVPLGEHRVQATDAISQATVEAVATVVTDGETRRDLTLAAFGQIRVSVTFARGAPAGGAAVGLNEGAPVTADSNGVAVFPVAAGSYRVEALHPHNPIAALRGQAQVTVGSSGQPVEASVVLGAAGGVHGRVVRPDGTTLAGGFPYEIRQIGGGDYRDGLRQTSAEGSYVRAGLPLGRYLITAYDAVQERFADAEFDVSADGQDVEVNLTLLDNRIALPADLRDANRFRYDVQPDGSLAAGSSGAYDRGAARLTVNGQAFSGASSARLKAARRQFHIEQSGSVAGLTLSRQIYVPRGSYFARYLDTFENPGAAPVSVTVSLQSRMPLADAVATSSGDAAVTAADRWVLADDADDADVDRVKQAPSLAHVFAAASGAQAPDGVAFAQDNGVGVLTQTWSVLTVPAGAKVSLLHFAVQQVNRRGARAAAERLLQLPPEALTDLAPAEASAVVNFSVPADLVGSVEPLPSLTASVRGTVYEGDGRTPVPSTRVTAQSEHPLFNRRWGLKADALPFCPGGTRLDSLLAGSGGVGQPAAGSYRFDGQLGADDSVAVPEGVPVHIEAQPDEGCFADHAGHPVTHIPSRRVTVTAPGEQNLLFDSGIVYGTAVGPADFSVTQGRAYLSIHDPDPPANDYVPIAPDATFAYPGLPPGRYDVLFDAPHPDAQTPERHLRGLNPQVEIAVGQVRAIEVRMQPTGRVQGTVLTANAEAVVNARVQLSGAVAGQSYDQCGSGCDAAALGRNRGKRPVQRDVVTDSLGRFDFSAVPAGSYRLNVIDPISGADNASTFDVEAGLQPTVRHVVLLALGSAQVQVNAAAGGAVADAYVYLRSSTFAGERVAGRTDAQGRLLVANVPQGDYTLRVADPRFGTAESDREVSGSIAANGERDDHTVVLRAAARLRVRALDGQAGNSPMGAVRVRHAAGSAALAEVGLTGADGWFDAGLMLDGEHRFQLVADDGRQSAASFAVDAAADGQVLTRELVLGGSIERDGVLSFAGERQLVGLTLAAGDRLSLSLRAHAHSGAPDACDVRAQLYDVGRTLRADGYGGGATGGYQQVNLSGDLRDSLAGDAGFYAVALSTLDPGCATAGYRIGASVNGTARALDDYSGGATVAGRLFGPDGLTPIAGAAVRLRGGDAPMLHAQATTGADGGFRFERVPTGGYRLQSVPAAPDEPVATADVSVATAGVTVNRDLHLPGTTRLDIEVRRPDGTPFGIAQLVFLAEPDFHEQRDTDTQGRLSYAYVGTAPLRVVAQDPADSSVWSERSLAPAPGQSIAVAFVLGPAPVQGLVRDGGGLPVSGALVVARRPGSSAPVGSASADGSGQYRLDALPSGTPLELRAADPQDAVVGEAVSLSAVAGQTTTQDLTLRGRGSLTGQVRHDWGNPIAGAAVFASYAGGSTGSPQQTVVASTDAQGRYRLNALPVGLPIAVRAVFAGSNGEIEATANTQIVGHGSESTLNFELDVPGGSVLARVASADALADSGACTFAISASGYSNSATAPCSGHTFDGVPVGPAQIALYQGDGDSPVATLDIAVLADARVDAVFLESVVHGAVRFADGTPAAGIDLSLTDAAGSRRSAVSADDGRYRIGWAAVGAFTLQAQDPNSGLRSEAAGSVAAVTAPVVVDLALPPAGSVVGSVLAQSGTPLADLPVYARSSGLLFDRQTWTDAQGQFRFDRVALGEVGVSAFDAQTQNVATAQTQLSSNGQSASVTLQFPLTGSLGGTVYRDGGPAAAACVELRSLADDQAHAQVHRSATADNAGLYAFSAVAPGPFLVQADACDGSRLTGLAQAAVGSNASTTVDLTLGNALPLSQRLADSASGYSVDVNGDGTLGPFDTASSSAFTFSGDGHVLSVGGVDFPRLSAAWSSQGGRELRLGPLGLAGLQVSRRVYVPAAGGYARLLETLSNPGTAAVTRTLRVSGSYRTFTPELRVSPAASAGRYAVVAPPEWDSLSAGLAGQVFGGSGGALPQVRIATSARRFEWSWSVTVAPGQTVSYLSYLVPRRLGDAGAAEQQTQRLAEMTEPGMFDGLSPAEKSQIQNFVVP